jgi:hypothetical protein
MVFMSPSHSTAPVTAPPLCASTGMFWYKTAALQLI